MNRNLIVSFIALPSLLASLVGSTSSGVTALNIPSNGNTSLNWAGYAATSGTFTGVGANWNVPYATAPTSTAQLAADATWVGIGGVSSHDLIQAGTQTIFQNGAPTYEAWYELLPADSVQVPLTVHPGDAMTVSLTETSAGEWQISFADASTGQNYTTSIAYQSSLSSAEWIEEMPSDQRGFVSLDNFGNVAFANGFAIENGSRVSLAGAGAQAMIMTNGAGQTLATTSSLGADGASFNVTRTNAPSNSASAVGFGGGSTGRGAGRWSRVGVGIQGFTPRPGRGNGSSSSQSSQPSQSAQSGQTGGVPQTYRVTFFSRGFPFFFREFNQGLRRRG